MAFSLLQNIANKALETGGNFVSGALNYLSKNGGQILHDVTNPMNVMNPMTFPTSKTGQDIGATVGRVLQQTPDTTVHLPKSPTYDLFKKSPITDTLFNKPADIQNGINEFITSIPGEALRSYGRTAERINTDKGRNQIFEGTKKIPEQVTKIVAKPGHRLEGASELLSNPAVEDALNLSDIFMLGAGTLAKKSGKEAVEAGVKQAVKTGVSTAEKKAVTTIVKEASQNIPSKIAKSTELFGNAGKKVAAVAEAVPEKQVLNETDMAMKALQKSGGAVQNAAEKVASVADDVIHPVTNETKNLFQKGTDIARKWINTREGFTNWRAADIKKTPALTQFDNEGLAAIKDLQSGANPARYKEIKDFTDGLFKLEEEAGILRPDQYRQHYLPQLWDNTPEEIDQVFKKIVGGKPGFSKSRLFEDYQKGIEAGLTPRYTQMSDLLTARYKTAQRALADKSLVDNLLASGQAKKLGDAPQGWVKVDLKHEGVPLAVDPQTAKIVNNYLGEGTKWLEKVATFVSNAKQTILSAGIPKTGWNFHTGVNVPVRRVAAGKNPFSGIVDSVIWNTHPQSAVDYIDNVVPKDITDGLLKEGIGITRSVEGSGYGFKPSDAGKFNVKDLNDWMNVPKLRTAFDNLFSEAAFDKILPAHKLKIGWETYQNALKNGATQDEAFKIGARTANEVFGGVNPAEFGRSKDAQNMLRTFLLAPDWLESNIRMGGKLGGLLNPSNWSKAEYAPYKRLAVNATAMYTSFAMTNKALSGHWPWENGPGQEFNLATGTFDERGRQRMVPAFGTAFDFIRIPYTVVSSVAGNDPQQALNIIKNRLSPPVSAVTNILSGQDYRGRDLFPEDNSPLQNIESFAGQAGQAVGVPSQVTNAITFMRGGSTAEELLAGLLEAPLRYQGGARTPSQVETANMLKESGATNQEINQAFSNQNANDGGFLGGLFGGGQDFKSYKDGKVPTFKSPKEKKAFDASVDNALANGASNLPENVIIARFFDGKTYDKSAKSGQQDILDKMLDVANDEYLTPEQKASIANAAKIDPIDLNYYRSASLDQTERLQGLIAYAADPANSEDRQTFLENLIMGKRSVGGKSLFSSQMYDYLYDQGLISKEEKALITAAKYDSLFDKFYMDRDYKGGGDGGTSAAKVKAYINSINAIFKNTFKTKKTKDAFQASEKDFAAIQPPKINLPSVASKGGAKGGDWFTGY